ncbi:MAG: DUF3343 domain-containing protein [Candidatus Coatesbacteria bacterium]|nr:DUF3343 domain-containing protein [Candidatus Coatesbacteria bacterium]
MKEARSVILFYSSSAALKMESLAKSENLVVKLIPIPRDLSSDCGICLLVLNDDMEEIKTIIDNHRIEYEGIHDYMV